MKKVKIIIFSNLTGEAFHEFLVIFRKLLEKYPNVQVIVVVQYDTFVNRLDNEAILLSAMRKSDYTQLIVSADNRADRCVTGMREVIAAALHHFDSTVVDAAKSLHNRFAAFGNITQKSYEEEPVALNLLIESLNSPEYADKVVTIGLSTWLLELQDATIAFEQLFEQRNAERSKLPEGTLRQSRKEIGEIYHSMIELINATALLGNNPELDEFIAQLNTEIDYFNEQNSRPAKKSLSADACFVNSVADQTFTGKPIVVIPSVFYREEGKPTQELVFAKDFSITYKNNTNVGTANIVIHGKGAYKNQRIITFNIVQ